MSNEILSYEVGLAIDIIPEKGGHCSFYLQLPIKSRFLTNLNNKKEVGFDTTEEKRREKR